MVIGLPAFQVQMFHYYASIERSGRISWSSAQVLIYVGSITWWVSKVIWRQVRQGSWERIAHDFVSLHFQCGYCTLWWPALTHRPVHCWQRALSQYHWQDAPGMFDLPAYVIISEELEQIQIQILSHCWSPVSCPSYSHLRHSAWLQCTFSSPIQTRFLSLNKKKQLKNNLTSNK